MNSITKPWQEALRIWLQQNPKTATSHQQKLREDFIRHFPIEKLPTMTLEQYAIGKPDSFCYWLEFKTNELGGIRGGNAAKFGVWWSKSEDRWRWNSSYQNAEEALTYMKVGLLALIEATRNRQFDALDKLGRDLLGYNRYSLRGKPLYLYFPEYFLPISNPEHLRYFLGLFGEKPQGDLLELNRQLLAHLRSLPQFDGFDTLQMMIFLYECMPPKKGNVPPKSTHQPKQDDPADSSNNNNRTTVFISYSHENLEEMNRLLLHLRAAKLNNNMVKWWDDTQIKPGARWGEEIKKAIASAYIAILLVSVDYLASEFILKYELPSILTAAEDDGVIILPVILGPCNFKYTELARFQAVNNPSIPLSKMNKHEADEVWNKVMEILHEMKPKDL